MKDSVTVPLNILLVTSRSWSSDDEFIAFGIRNLIDGATGTFNNYVAYNTNPDLHLQRLSANRINFHNAAGETINTIDLSDYIKQTNWVSDNSWHKRTSLEQFDLVVFGGTPAWYGPLLAPLTEALAETSVPVIYLGIGSPNSREEISVEGLTDNDRALIDKAKLITSSDKSSAAQLKLRSASHLPSPTLFAADFEKTRRTRRKFKLAFSFETAESRQSTMSAETSEWCHEIATQLGEQFEAAWICQYIDELAQTQSRTQLPVHYSYDPKDYLHIYNQFDILITTRLPAAGLAASMGIPSFVVSEDTGAAALNGTLSESFKVGQSFKTVEKRLQDISLNKWSSSIVKHKKAMRKDYEALLSPVLAELTSSA